MLVFDHTKKFIPETFGVSMERTMELQDIYAEKIQELGEDTGSYILEFTYNSNEFSDGEKIFIYMMYGASALSQ